MVELKKRDSTKDELLNSLDKFVTENLTTDQQEKMLSISSLVFSQTSVAFTLYKNGSIASELKEFEFKILMIMIMIAMYDHFSGDLDIDEEGKWTILTLGIADGYLDFPNCFDYYIEEAIRARDIVNKIIKLEQDWVRDIFAEAIEISKKISDKGSPFPILKFFEKQELVLTVKEFFKEIL